MKINKIIIETLQWLIVGIVLALSVIILDFLINHWKNPYSFVIVNGIYFITFFYAKKGREKRAFGNMKALEKDPMAMMSLFVMYTSAFYLTLFEISSSSILLGLPILLLFASNFIAFLITLGKINEEQKNRAEKFFEISGYVLGILLFLKFIINFV